MRTRKAFYNMLCAMLHLIINIVCGFIAPRLILKAFGSSYNGIISSASQFLGIIGLLNIGVAGPTRVALYESFAKEDILQTSRIVKATKIHMRKIALILVVYSLILILIYPHFVHTDIPKKEIVLLLIIITCSSFAQYFFSFTNEQFLDSVQDNYIYNFVKIIKIIINTILIYLLILFGYSIFWVQAGSSIIFFLCPFILELYINHKYKLILNCEPDFSAIKERKAAAYHSIANIIHNNTDVILLTMFSNIKIVSVYAVYNIVIIGIRNTMRVFTNALEAPFGNMWAKKEINILKKNFVIYEFSIFFFASIMFSCSYILILPFIQRYTNGVNDINYLHSELAFWIITAECLFCLRQPYLTLVQATGNYDETKYDAVAEAVINVVASIILLHYLGICGVIIGTLIANLYRTLRFSLFIDNNILQRKSINLLFRLLWLSLMLILNNIILNQLLLHYEFALNWLGWLTEALFSLIISIVTTLFGSILFYKSDLKKFLQIFKRIFTRKHKDVKDE